MKLNKINELAFTDNDAYIFEKINRNFIVNNDYNGILMLDSDLHINNSVITNKLPGIYSIFFNDNGNELLLYCPDENKLIYCSFLSKKFFSINIDWIESQEVLSPLFHWNNNKVILSTFNFNFYEFDCKSSKLKEITSASIELNYPEFFNFYHETKKHSPFERVDSHKMNFIYKDEKKDEIIFYDYKNKKKISIKKPLLNYHDVVFYKGYFIFVAEKKILIAKNKLTYSLSTQEPFVFLRANCILEDEALYLVVLATNNSVYKNSKIIKFKLLNP